SKLESKQKGNIKNKKREKKNYLKSAASFIIFLYIHLQTHSSHLIPSPFIPNLKSKEHICTADSRLVCNLQQYLHFMTKTSKNQDKKFQCCLGTNITYILLNTFKKSRKYHYHLDDNPRYTHH
ncbi:hypothetical protein ES319_D13G085800v1, partial [Gossypium barbadense]